MNRSVRDVRPHPIDDETPMGNRGFVVALLAVVLIAFGGFVWNIYGGREPAHIMPPPVAYKTAPSNDSMIAALPEDAPMNAPADAPEVPLDENTISEASAAPAPAEARGAPRLTAAPSFVGNGPFVAQLAALQSEDAIEPAWIRLSTRAPDLFRSAHLDVERADLGARGIYYRVRAGYFADRTQAGRFCERIRGMGQDCIVVSR